MAFLSVLLLFCLSTLSSAFPAPMNVTGDTGVHDPTLCKDAHGTYFLFATAQGISIKTSKDRVNWTEIGSVWPGGASWTDPFTLTSNGVLWAPDCTIINGTFYLYYAASSFGSQNSAIFLAKSQTGLPGSWKHKGLITSTITGDTYNAIDPNLLIHGDHWVLSLGSFWTGIKLQKLQPQKGYLLSPSVTSLAERFVNSGAIEASVIFKHGRFFYLFTSWDFCCQGVSSTYNIRVGRSLHPHGVFVDQAGVDLIDGGGTLVLGTHDNIVGPGGQDLMMDDDGPILIYHYYTPTGSFLGLNRLDFSSGWPVVI